MTRPDEVLVEGEVSRVTFENAESGFRVVKVAVSGRKDKLAVVGTFPALSVGARVRIRGTMVTDKKHGEQLKAAAVTEILPSTIDGVERYLASGVVPGVGGKTAKRIVSAFGIDTLRVLDEQPDRLREVEGLGEKRARAVVKAWTDQKALRDVMVFLQARDISTALAHRIWKRFGSRAVDVVSRNPYALALEVWGIGFKTADRLAVSLGVARDSPDRLRAGVLQALHDATESGHVYTTAEQLVESAGKLLEVDLGAPGVLDRLRQATGSLGASGLAVTETVPAAACDAPPQASPPVERRVYEARLNAAERRLARRALDLTRSVAPPLPGADRAVSEFESLQGVELGVEQRQAIAEAARSSVMVITGGPGVGKTTIVRAILSIFERAGLETRLAAPTGRAAKRMSEATGREASTLHRLLEFEPRRATFKRDAKRPIPARAVIVDEASMVDLLLADALFQAVEPGTRLVLVGDVDQLPSIGPGAVLRDVIASGKIPSVRLTQIFRQARQSLIVTNAHRINAGLVPVAPEAGASSDFFMIDRRDPESAQRTVVELVASRIPGRFGMDPVRDIQVLTPMHRGAAGSRALNQALQLALNPTGPEVVRGALTLRKGDKVMQLKNDYERGVYNGDVGVVLDVDTEEGSLLVGYDSAGPLLAAADGDVGAPPGPREVKYDAENLDWLTLAYAQSVHKAQGSEYGAVVIPLLTSHFVMLSRNLLYTAVTRGKRLVVLVADPRALALALGRDRRDERRSRLAERIGRELA